MAQRRFEASQGAYWHTDLAIRDKNSLNEVSHGRRKFPA